MVATFCWLLAAHFLADYPLQGSYLAATKGTNPPSLVAHAAIWTGTICAAAIVLGLHPGLVLALLLFASHAAIDWAKARKWTVFEDMGDMGALTLDQTFHVFQIIFFLATLPR